jgi:hypothetical protein
MHRVGRFSGAGAGTEPLVDRFTIGHVAWGSMLGLAAVPWWLVLGQAVLWELVENPLKRALPQVFPSARSDSFAAAAVDVAAVMAGWGAMRALPPGPEPAIWRAPPGWG